MPTFSVPALSASQLIDGTPLGPNQTVVPVMLVVDANGKIASFRGAEITLADVVAPTISSHTVAQGASDYVFKPSGSVSDDADGTLEIYHIITTATKTQPELEAIINTSTAGTNYMKVENTSYVAGATVDIFLEALGTSQVLDEGSFRDIAEGDSVFSYVVAKDAGLNGSPNYTVSEVNVGTVADHTPPTFGELGFGTITKDTIQITGLETANDNGTGVKSVSLFYSDSNVVGDASAYSGNPITTIPVSDFNMDGLAQLTSYYVWASAVDAAENETQKIAVGGPGATATTVDGTDPDIAGVSVSQVGGVYEFKVSGGTISDNVNGTLKLYLIMSATDGLNDADLSAAAAGVEESAKIENFVYAASSGAVNIPTTLSTKKFWNGNSFEFIAETTPPLRAYIYAVDAAGLDGSGKNGGEMVAVAATSTYGHLLYTRFENNTNNEGTASVTTNADISGTIAYDSSGVNGSAIALRTEGINRSVKISGLNLQGVSFTLSFWIKWDLGNGVGDDKWAFLFLDNNDTPIAGLRFDSAADNNYPAFRTYIDSTLTVQPSGMHGAWGNPSSTPFTDGNWHMVTIMYDSSTTYGYIDNLIPPAPTDAYGTGVPPFVDGMSLVLGSYSGQSPSQSSWTGWIDSVVLQEGILTTDEIAAMWARNGVE